MLAINIPADGFCFAIQKRVGEDYSERNCRRAIEEYVSKILEAKPDMIFLNVCYRRSLTPSEVFDDFLYDVETDENGYAKRDGNGKTLKRFAPAAVNFTDYFLSFVTCARKLLENGVDIYETAIKTIQKAGCKAFLSIRMNDGHYTDNPAFNSAFAMKNGGEYTIGKDGVALDFSLEPVQNHFYQYVEALLERYTIDGIELDWLRNPTGLSESRRSDFSILNGFMERIRNLMNTRDEKLSLAVRVPPNEKDSLCNGIDVCQWIVDEFVDIVTIENFYIPTNYELPVSEWRNSIQKRNISNHPYLLLCGSDWGVSCVQNYHLATTPALVRGFAEVCNAKGADGIYLFNLFEEVGTSAWEFTVDQNGDVRLQNCFLERLKAANEAGELPKRYVHIGDSNARYPIPLEGKRRYAFYQAIRPPYGKLKLTVGVDKDVPITVVLNGEQDRVALLNEPIYPGYEYVPETEILKRNHFIYAVSQAAPFVKSVKFSEFVVKNGGIEIEIENGVLEDVKILWIDVSCERNDKRVKACERK